MRKFCLSVLTTIIIICVMTFNSGYSSMLPNGNVAECEQAAPCVLFEMENDITNNFQNISINFAHNNIDILSIYHGFLQKKRIII